MQNASKRTNRLGLPVMLLATLVAGVGCTSAPRGDTGGRFNPYESTSSDRTAKDQVSMQALLEFSDETAQKLVYELSAIPEIRDAPTQVVLELGDIQNKTRNTSTIDFELVQRRLRSKIQNSSLARENFLIVESAHRMDREKNRVTGPGVEDLLQEGAGSTATARYSPDITYVLQGDFLQSYRAGASRYYFELKLTNIGSRQIVFSNSYVLGQGG